jgi:2-haloacid dehalogenase
MKKFIFIDLDDTLFDFHRGEAESLSQTLLKFGIEPTPTRVARYSEINDGEWKRLERGEITRAEVLYGRFEKFFSELGVVADISAVKQEYEARLSSSHIFLEGAEEMLEALLGKYKLYLASNGTAAVQRRRIAESGIDKYFDGIFISEEIGANKPSIEYFESCFAKIDGFSREDAIILGDSLSSDILGGKVAKIDTCLFNPKGKKLDTGITPDYEVRTHAEFRALISKL